MSATNEPVCQAVSVNHIAISVSNLAQSRDWYCKMFGLRLIQDSDQSVLLGFGNSMLVLRQGSPPGTISHFMFGLDRFDAEALKAGLADQGLQPRRDAESFHVRDSDGLDIQVGDKGLGLATGIVENGFKLR